MSMKYVIYLFTFIRSKNFHHLVYSEKHFLKESPYETQHDTTSASILLNTPYFFDFSLNFN